MSNVSNLTMDLSNNEIVKFVLYYRVIVVSFIALSIILLLFGNTIICALGFIGAIEFIRYLYNLRLEQVKEEQLQKEKEEKEKMEKEKIQQLQAKNKRAEDRYVEDALYFAKHIITEIEDGSNDQEIMKVVRTLAKQMKTRLFKNHTDDVTDLFVVEDDDILPLSPQLDSLSSSSPQKVF